MARAKPPYEQQPRYLNRYQVASLLNMCEETLKKKLPELQQKGFPAYDALIGGYDSDAIEEFLDARSGIGVKRCLENEYLSRING